MSERSRHFPFSMEHWAAQSVQERPDERALREEDMGRAQVRFWLFAAALAAVVILSLTLEIIRRLAGGSTISVWRCLGGMMPGLLGLIVMWVVSIAFVRDIYAIPDRRSALSYVRLLLFGRASLSLLDRTGFRLAPYPSLTVQQGRIDEKYENTPLARLGGPGNVLIFHDSAVCLERFGRFIRVAGPGAVFLRRFERIHEVLDLRPQERSETVTALTRDGIPVRTEVQVRFQLAHPPASLIPPTPDTPHPVYRWALTQASQRHLRLIVLDRNQEQIMHWPAQVMANVGSTLRDIIAGYRLDELLEPYEPGRDPRGEIIQRLRSELDAAARDCGAQVVEVRMGALEPTLEEVKRERITSWQVAWKSEARKEKAKGEAEAIRQGGLARAYAQMEIILSLAREFQDAVERGVVLPAEIVILRFMEALRQTWSRPGGTFMSSQMFNMWQVLQRDLKQLVGPAYLLSEGETGVDESHGDRE